MPVQSTPEGVAPLQGPSPSHAESGGRRRRKAPPPHARIAPDSCLPRKGRHRAVGAGGRNRGAPSLRRAVIAGRRGHPRAVIFRLPPAPCRACTSPVDVVAEPSMPSPVSPWKGRGQPPVSMPVGAVPPPVPRISTRGAPHRWLLCLVARGAASSGSRAAGEPMPEGETGS